MSISMCVYMYDHICVLCMLVNRGYYITECMYVSHYGRFGWRVGNDNGDIDDDEPMIMK